MSDLIEFTDSHVARAVLACCDVDRRDAAMYLLDNLTGPHVLGVLDTRSIGAFDLPRDHVAHVAMAMLVNVLAVDGLGPDDEEDEAAYADMCDDDLVAARRDYDKYGE